MQILWNILFFEQCSETYIIKQFLWNCLQGLNFFFITQELTSDFNINIPYEYTHLIDLTKEVTFLSVNHDILNTVKTSYLMNDYVYYLNQEFDWLNAQLSELNYSWLKYYSLETDVSLPRGFKYLQNIISNFIQNIISILHFIVILNEKLIWNLVHYCSSFYQNFNVFWYSYNIVFSNKYQYSVLFNKDLYYPATLEVLGKSNNWNIITMEYFIKNKVLFQVDLEGYDIDVDYLNYKNNVYEKSVFNSTSTTIFDNYYNVEMVNNYGDYAEDYYIEYYKYCFRKWGSSINDMLYVNFKYNVSTNTATLKQHNFDGFTFGLDHYVNTIETKKYAIAPFFSQNSMEAVDTLVFNQNNFLIKHMYNKDILNSDFPKIHANYALTPGPMSNWHGYYFFNKRFYYETFLKNLPLYFFDAWYDHTTPITYLPEIDDAYPRKPNEYDRGLGGYSYNWVWRQEYAYTHKVKTVKLWRYSWWHMLVQKRRRRRKLKIILKKTFVYAYSFYMRTRFTNRFFKRMFTRFLLAETTFPTGVRIPMHRENLHEFLKEKPMRIIRIKDFFVINGRKARNLHPVKPKPVEPKPVPQILTKAKHIPRSNEDPIYIPDHLSDEQKAWMARNDKAYLEDIKRFSNNDEANLLGLGLAEKSASIVHIRMLRRDLERLGHDPDEWFRQLQTRAAEIAWKQIYNLRYTKWWWQSYHVWYTERYKKLRKKGWRSVIKSQWRSNWNTFYRKGSLPKNLCEKHYSRFYSSLQVVGINFYKGGLHSIPNTYKYITDYFEADLFLNKSSKNLYGKIFKNLVMYVYSERDITQQSKIGLHGEYQELKHLTIHKKTYTFYIDNLIRAQNLNTTLKSLSIVEDFTHNFKQSNLEYSTEYNYPWAEDNLNILEKYNNITRGADTQENPLIWKKNYVRNTKQLFNEDRYFYQNYFFWKENKKMYITFWKNLKIFFNNVFSNYMRFYYAIIHVLSEYAYFKPFWKNVLKIKQFFIEYKTALIITLILTIYITLSNLFLVTIKSNMPKNLIFALKTDPKKIKENKKNPFKWWEGGSRFSNINVWITSETKLVYIWKNQKLLQIEKKSDLDKNYDVLFKRFTFEKNLEKYADLSKLRGPVFNWIHHFIAQKNNSKFIILVKLVRLYYQDKWFNHNRTINWKDLDLELESKIQHIFWAPRLFFRFFVIFKLIWTFIQFWKINATVKWKQVSLFNTGLKFNYLAIERSLTEDLSLGWFRKNLDIKEDHYYDNIRVLCNLLRETKKIKIDDIDIPSEPVWTVNKHLPVSIEDVQLILKSDLYEVFDKKSDLLKDFLKENQKEEKPVYFPSEIDITEINEQVDAELTVKRNYAFQVRRLKLEEEAADKAKKLLISDIAEVLKQQNTYDKFLIVDLININSAHKIAIIENEFYIRSEDKDLAYTVGYLNQKEESYFQQIPGYKEDLAAALKVLKDKGDSGAKRRFDKKTLFKKGEDRYILFKWFTSLGSRFFYLMSLFIIIFRVWVIQVKRVRRNELTVTNLFNINLNDNLNILYKIYWEYVILQKDYKSFKKFGGTLLNVLKFVIIILCPILLYIYSLSILLYIFKFFREKLFFIKIKDHANYKYTIIYRLYTDLMADFSIYAQIFKLLFWNAKTEEFILVRLYLKIYNLCGFFQKNSFLIRKSYALGGIYAVAQLYKLKFKVYFEKKKIFEKKIYKTKQKKKNLLKLSDELHLAILFYISTNLGFLKKIRKSMFLLCQYTMMIAAQRYYNVTFDVIRPFLIKEIVDYFNNIWWGLSYIKLYRKNLTIWAILILLFKLLINPLLKFKHYQMAKFVKNYEVGIIGFWKNPMYQIIDKPSPNKGKFKQVIYNFFMDLTVSNWIHMRRTTVTSRLEMFLLRKTKEYPPNFYVKRVRARNYKAYYHFKDRFYRYIYNIIYSIEYDFSEFDKHYSGGHQIPIWKRFFIIKKMRKMKQLHEREEFKKVLHETRKIIFYKKMQDRKKITRRYYFFAIINFLSYILFKKVIFSKKSLLFQKEKLLKKQKVNLKKYDMTFTIFDETVGYHIGLYLLNIAPELWLLVLLHEYLNKNLFRYVFNNESQGFLTASTMGESEFKWRITPTVGKIEYYCQGRLSTFTSAANGHDIPQNMARGPLDLNMIYILFAFEQMLGSEELDVLFNKKIWADVSLGGNAYRPKPEAQHKAEMDKIKWYWTKKQTREYVDGLEADSTLRFERHDWRFNYKFGLKSKLEKEKLLNYILTEKKEYIDRALIFRDGFANYNKIEPEKYVTAWQDEIEDVYISSGVAYDPGKAEYSLQSHFWDYAYSTSEGTWPFLRAFCDDKSFNINTFLLYTETASYNITLDLIATVLKKELIKIKKPYINHINLHIEPNIMETINYFLQPMSRFKDPDSLCINPVTEYRSIMANMIEVDYYQNDDPLKKNYFILKMNESGFGYDLWLQLLEDPWVSHETLIAWTPFADLQRLYSPKAVERRVHMTPLVFINHIKWSWGQWVGLELISKEKTLLRYRNTVILNERYQLLFVKKAPIRVKIPVVLDLHMGAVKELLRSRFNYLNLDTRFFFPGASFNGLVRRSASWHATRVKLEEQYQMPMAHLIFNLFNVDPEATEIEELEVFKKKHRAAINILIRKVSYFFRLNLKAMVEHCWDMLTYHSYWNKEVDDFEIDRYYIVKVKEFLRSDELAVKWMDHYEISTWFKYDPSKYVRFFYQALGWYWVFFLLQYLSWVIVLYILLYEPGTYILHFPPLLLFMALGWYFSMAKKSAKAHRRWLAGKELYLYKYKVFGNTPIPKKYNSTFFSDVSRLEHIYHEQNVPAEKSTWWEVHRLLYYKHRYYTWRRSFGMMLVFAGICSHYVWENTKHWYRDFGWDFFKRRVIKRYSDMEGFNPDYSKIIWFDDCYGRLLAGGNTYSVWYANIYRKQQGLKLWELDKDAARHNMPKYKYKIYNFTYHPYPHEDSFRIVGNKADIEWTFWSHMIKIAKQEVPESLDLDTMRFPWSLSFRSRNRFYKWFLHEEKVVSWKDTMRKLDYVWANFIEKSIISTKRLISADDKRLVNAPTSRYPESNIKNVRLEYESVVLHKDIIVYRMLSDRNRAVQYLLKTYTKDTINLNRGVQAPLNWDLLVSRGVSYEQKLFKFKSKLEADLSLWRVSVRYLTGPEKLWADIKMPFKIFITENQYFILEWLEFCNDLLIFLKSLF